MAQEKNKILYWKIAVVALAVLTIIFIVISVLQYRDKNTFKNKYETERTNYRKYKSVESAKIKNIQRLKAYKDSVETELQIAKDNLSKFEAQRLDEIQNKYKPFKYEQDTINTINGHVNLARRLLSVNDSIPSPKTVGMGKGK